MTIPAQDEYSQCLWISQEKFLRSHSSEQKSLQFTVLQKYKTAINSCMCYIYISLRFQLREDLGDIKYCPTIVAVFFADDGIEIRKAEGEENIRMAIRSGVIHRGIKEFIDKRVKLKIAEKMAEHLLVGVINSLQLFISI